MHTCLHRITARCALVRRHVHSSVRGDTKICVHILHWYWHPVAFINWSTVEGSWWVVIILLLFIWNLIYWFPLTVHDLACLPTYLWTSASWLWPWLAFWTAYFLLPGIIFAQLLLTLACYPNSVLLPKFTTILLICSWPQFCPDTVSVAWFCTPLLDCVFPGKRP